ncbi:MAG: hypothetical protein Q4E55_04240, partial [Bacteroidales bacterium]|nr:hypothetical protein [Bacteroidales bacterium]
MKQNEIEGLLTVPFLLVDLETVLKCSKIFYKIFPAEKFVSFQSQWSPIDLVFLLRTSDIKYPFQSAALGIVQAWFDQLTIRLASALDCTIVQTSLMSLGLASVAPSNKRIFDEPNAEPKLACGLLRRGRKSAKRIFDEPNAEPKLACGLLRRGRKSAKRI